MPAQKEILNRNPNRKDMQYTITQDGERRFEKTNSQYKQKKIPT
jgi:hypothetical protein